jgi:hypothetical protein
VFGQTCWHIYAGNGRGLQKRLRAITDLRCLLAGGLALSALLKLNGLLEHFLYVFGLKRNFMSTMYEPLQTAEREGTLIKHPDALVKPSVNMNKCAGRWIKFIARVAGATACRYTGARHELCADTMSVPLHTDAAVCGDVDSPEYVLDEHENGLGLGGYAAGYWYNWPLSEEAKELPAAVLELMALVVGILVLAPPYLGVVWDKCILLLYSDSTYR